MSTVLGISHGMCHTHNGVSDLKGLVIICRDSTAPSHINVDELFSFKKATKWIINLCVYHVLAVCS